MNTYKLYQSFQARLCPDPCTLALGHLDRARLTIFLRALYIFIYPFIYVFADPTIWPHCGTMEPWLQGLPPKDIFCWKIPKSKS